MGVDRTTAFLLLAEASVRPFTGTVLQLGRQDVTVSRKMVAAMSKRFELRRPDGNGVDAADGESFMSDHDFFRYAGFQDVQSLDNSAFEGATFVFDMNSRMVPEHLRNRFDVLFDGGTMEHVFDTPQFLKNVHEMLKVGGRIIHFSPTFNHVNHGFYFYSPTFFLDYYEANGYTLNRLDLVRVSLKSAHGCDCLNPDVYRYVDKVRGGGGAYYTFVSASKKADSRADVIPQQGLYRELWSGPRAQAATPWLQGVARRLSRKSFTHFRIMNSLRGWFLNSWVYRQHVGRRLQWTRLPI